MNRFKKEQYKKYYNYYGAKIEWLKDYARFTLVDGTVKSYLYDKDFNPSNRNKFTPTREKISTIRSVQKVIKKAGLPIAPLHFGWEAFDRNLIFS